MHSWKVLYKDSPFRPDWLTNMTVIGSSCFWLVGHVSDTYSAHWASSFLKVDPCFCVFHQCKLQCKLEKIRNLRYLLDLFEAYQNLASTRCAVGLSWLWSYGSWVNNYPVSVQSVPITTNVVSLNPTQARCTWYNIIW